MNYDIRKNYRKEPYMVNLLITEYCPLKCKQCYQSQTSTNNYMHFSQIKKYVLELKEMGVQIVQLSGGEPLTHPNIVEIVEYIKSRGFICKIATSGYNLSNSIIKKFVDLKLDALHISLNGSEKEINSVSRDGYQYAINALEQAHIFGQLSIINWVAHHKNIDDLPNVVELAKRMNATIDVLMLKEGTPDLSECDLNDLKQIKKVIEKNKGLLKVESCFITLRLLMDEKISLIDRGCLAARFHFSISQSGYAPCPHFCPSMPLHDIGWHWNNDIDFNKLRMEQRNLYKFNYCKSCKYSAKCFLCRFAVVEDLCPLFEKGE